MILVGHFQLRIFYDPQILWCTAPTLVLHRAKLRAQQSICRSALGRTFSTYTFSAFIVHVHAPCMCIQKTYLHVLSVIVDFLSGEQQICVTWEGWGEISCRNWDFFLPEWCVCCQVAVSLFLSESYYTNQLLIQLIMKNMQKNISRSWFRVCYVRVIEQRKLIWVRRLWFLIPNVTDFHSFELKSDLHFIFLRVQLYSSIDTGMCGHAYWACSLMPDEQELLWMQRSIQA